MFKWIWSRSVVVLGLIVALGILSVGCKKDETTNPGGGGGITTFNFTTPGQMLILPSSGVAVKAKLTGGTLPYTVAGPPNIAVATATLSYDTITVTPVAAGSTTITIADSLGDRVVTIGITVTGGGGTLGSGTTTASSTGGNLSLAGTGTWPPGAGPGVIAVYDTVTAQFIILGYQQVSGSHYNYILVGALTPGGPAAGTYTISSQTGYFQVGYNADTSSTDTSAYTATSGSVIISSVTGLNAQGTYSGQAVKGSPPPIQFNGTFNVAFVRGRSPIQIGEADAGGRKSFGASVGKKPETQRERLR